MNSIVKRIILEEITSMSGKLIAYHGTRSPFPFTKFDPISIGTGLVSSGQKFNGFFFTTEYENAEFYTEYFIATVEITGAQPNPTSSTHPPTVLQQASKDNKIYVVSDVLDGGAYSDIVVVPKQLISSNVKIVKWDFVGDEESYFESLDRIFSSGEEDDFINQDMIRDTISMIELDINYLLSIPVFKKYYLSKG